MEYEKYLLENQEEMVKALQEALRYNSEGGDRVETADGQVYPFGEGVQKCFEAVLKMGQDMGFEAVNVDNYGGHIDFVGTGEDGKAPKILGIIGHLDVVPAGSGWDFEPYGAEVKDGMVYGRGTTDDKGPVISCLYAMKALKDSGYEPKNTIRLIIGLDEETNWKGIEYYFNKVERPDFGFTPDGDFPIINGEKGILTFELAKKFEKVQEKGLELRSFSGGTASNSVADTAKAVVRYSYEDKKANKDEEVAKQYDRIKSLAEAYREKTGYKLSVKGAGKSLEISSVGKAAHGAKPDAGLNAVSILMEFLGQLSFVNEGHNEFIHFFNKHIGFELDGKSMGIAMEDEPSGKLTFNVGIGYMDEEVGKVVINVRYPVTADDEDIYNRFKGILEEYDLGIIKEKASKPIFKDVENPMIKDLMDIYQKHTGDYENKPLVIGGGTYARATDNIVAYGALFPGDPDVMHQKNECLSLERFYQMTKIYAEAIYKLSSEDYNM